MNIVDIILGNRKLKLLTKEEVEKQVEQNELRARLLESETKLLKVKQEHKDARLKYHDEGGIASLLGGRK